jgi:hypothetical protein
MEVVVDYAALKGARSETIVKELAVAGKYFIQSYHFKSPYPVTPKILDNNESYPAYIYIYYAELSIYLTSFFYQPWLYSAQLQGERVRGI